jgi:hypothetical protein
MEKKAELTIETIIIAILCLLVLVVLIFMFREQITALGKGFMNIISGTVDSTNQTADMISDITK